MKKILWERIFWSAMMLWLAAAIVSMSYKFYQVFGRTSDWTGFFFCIFIGAIITFCSGHRHREDGRAGYFAFLFLTGFIAATTALTAQFLINGSSAGLIGIVIAVTVTSMFLIGHLVKIYESDVTALIFIVGAYLTLIAIIAIHTKDATMVWLCLGYLAVVKVLIIFGFEDLRRLYKLAAETKKEK